jgi:hypothetical protein
MDTAVLNAAATLWVDPPRNITRDLRDLGGSVCDVVCLGREWTSLSRRDTLVLIMYRTTAFEEAVQAAYSARFIYLARGFELASLPPGVSLAAHTWIASRGDREFVIFTSQGPAVLSLFWHSQQSAPVENTLASLARYMNVQARILRLNGYLTVNPNATPPP